MTVDKLILGSTDLSEYVQSITVDMAAPGTVSQGFIQTVRLRPPSQDELEYKRRDWESVMDDTVRPIHHNLTSKVFMFDCITTPLPPSFDQSVGRLDSCRCSMVNLDDYLDNLTNSNLVRLIRKALRTYPKRMSRAKRKEARAREHRRRIKDNQWWSKR